ncbi:MAG: hypothetical protein ACI4JB_11635 [Porcipelethomonas sp.]
MGNYDDIIAYEHYTSKKHHRMPPLSRAVQFAPFAALTGLDDDVNEAARITEIRHELTDDEKNILDMKMQFIERNIQRRPFVTITYFKNDSRKQGGAYHTFSGNIRRIEQIEGYIIFEGGRTVNIEDVMFISMDNRKQENY